MFSCSFILLFPFTFNRKNLNCNYYEMKHDC